MSCDPFDCPIENEDPAMPDRIEKLRATLAELHEELHELDSLDADSRQLLEEAAEELHAALDPHDATLLEHASIAERFKRATEKFDREHPTLSRIVGNMVDALGQMGI